MQGVKTYDPNNVQVIMGGVPIGGFADGTFVSIAFDEDQFAKTVGADGEVSRSKSNNNSATITMTLKQTSASNDALSGFAQADNLDGSGAVPLMIKEIGSGRTLCFTQAAWVQKLPDVGYSKEVEDRAWTIATAQMNVFIGGNATSTQSEA